jgi:hypothetical protein
VKPRSNEDVIESLEGIVEDMRAILVQQGEDREILREARIALSDWFIATYPHLYPGQDRPRLRVLKGGKREGPPESRQPPLMGSS